MFSQDPSQQWRKKEKSTEKISNPTLIRGKSISCAVEIQSIYISIYLEGERGGFSTISPFCMSLLHKSHSTRNGTNIYPSVHPARDGDWVFFAAVILFSPKTPWILSLSIRATISSQSLSIAQRQCLVVANNNKSLVNVANNIQNSHLSVTSVLTIP